MGPNKAIRKGQFAVSPRPPARLICKPPVRAPSSLIEFFRTISCDRLAEQSPKCLLIKLSRLRRNFVTDHRISLLVILCKIWRIVILSVPTGSCAKCFVSRSAAYLEVKFRNLRKKSCAFFIDTQFFTAYRHFVMQKT